MKKSLIKISAIILVFAIAIGCCLISSIAASTDPTFTIVGNGNAPLAEGNNNTTLTFNATNLSVVKGLDLTIKAPSGLSFTGLSGSFINSSDSSKNITLVENTNFTKTSNTIRIVSAFVKKPVDSLSATISLSGSNLTIGNYELTFNAVTLVNASEQKIQSGSYNLNTGSLVIGKTVSKSTNPSTSGPANLEKPENTFIPFGGVYIDLGSGNYSYPTKNSDGSFNLESGKSYNYKAFKLPTNAGLVTTFSSSQQAARPSSPMVSLQSDGIQFVSYALDKSQSHGTLIFKGDFNDFFNEKKSQYPTKQELFAGVIGALMNNEVAASTFKTLNYANKTKSIQAAYIPQVKKMWSNANVDNGALQYALRVYNVLSSDVYTAVGYTNNGGYKFSDEYQTAQFGKVNGGLN